MHSRFGIYPSEYCAHSDAASKETEWAPHNLPTTEFDGTGMDDQLEAAAEALSGDPAAEHGAAAGAGRQAGRQIRSSRNTPSASIRRNSAGFYADMAKIRRFDQEATALQRQGQLALWVPLTGQEAAQIGSGRASQPQDYIFPTYREHGVALTRNVDLAEVLRQFSGVSNGGWNPKDTNFHLYTLVLAAQTPHAVGYAMGIQRDQKLAAAAATRCRQKARGRSRRPPSWPTSVTVPARKGTSMSPWSSPRPTTPVVFFCQNNHWAISVHSGPDPGPAGQPRQGLWLPRHPGGRQ